VPLQVPSRLGFSPWGIRTAEPALVSSTTNKRIARIENFHFPYVRDSEKIVSLHLQLGITVRQLVEPHRPAYCLSARRPKEASEKSELQRTRALRRFERFAGWRGLKFLCDVFSSGSLSRLVYSLASLDQPRP
jgi:hypothetical protein